MHKRMMSSQMYLKYLLLSYFFVYVVCEEIDINNVKIWGPGLNPEKIVMPARYFFIETGVRTQSPVPGLETKVHGLNKFNINCQVWVNTLDRKDGSFIIRYKLYETCFNFKIEITYKTKHVAESPYVFKDPIYPDDCNCPEKNVSHWMDNLKCRKTYMQIEKDLLPFSSVNLTDLKPIILSHYNKPASHSICNYVISNNEIYRKCYGKYVGFNIFMDSILLSLARKIHLPDLEFFVNLGDWPLAQRNKKALPMFSWCGSDNTYDIVMPTYDVTESTLENMGRVMLDMLSVQGNINLPWKSKIPKVFWRGRDSNPRRLELIDISRKHPDLFNVSLTNFFFYRNKIEEYGPKTEHVSFFTFFDYKYQLNIDGTVAAYRFPYLLAGDSLVMKQDSEYYEWFYKSLKPGHHYLQVNENLSNLLEKLKWAMDNDEEALKIAQNGQKFAREHLLPQNIFCYYATLLMKWSERLVSTVSVSEDMEHVIQPEPKHACDCNMRIKDEL